MSLAFGPSEFITCIHLAQKVWRRCRYAPEGFHAVSTEVANLELVLGEVQESVSGYELSERRKNDLRQLIVECNDVLMVLQGLFHKHKNLGSESKRSCNRLSWSRDPVYIVRQRLVAKIGLLTTFNVSIISASQARVQKLLQQLLFEHQAGLRENLVISSKNLKLAEEGNGEAWFHIGRELEDVGITSFMIRDHRQYIIRWIKQALKLGKLNEGADLPSTDFHSPSPSMQEDEKYIAITEESVSIRTTGSQVHDFLDEPRSPRESTITMSELSADSVPEPRDPPRPGDVTLSDKQSRQYRCAHVYCKGRPDRRYTTWFEILLHARTDHSTGSTPWSKYHLADSQEADLNLTNLLCVNDSGKYLASYTPYTNIPADQDRDEVAYVLTTLYRAVRNGSIPVEIPQLIQHFIRHYEAQCQNDMQSVLHVNNTSFHLAPNREALARVQRRYICLSEERTTRNRGFRGLRIFKRSKRNLPNPSREGSFLNTVPYCTTFSGQTIESIAGEPVADSTRVSLTLNNQRQPSLRPELQPHNKSNRYSRPTAFALIPELRIAQDDEKRTSSDHAPSTTRAGSDFQVSSHALSEKLKATEAEREGVLFIMASLRQTLGVSK